MVTANIELPLQVQDANEPATRQKDANAHCDTKALIKIEKTQQNDLNFSIDNC